MEWVTGLQQAIVSGQHTAWYMFFAIIILSYILEDVAIVTAASVATSELITPSLALLAIFIGIASGDVGLYFIGKLGRKNRYLRYRTFKNRYFKVARSRLMQRSFWNLFIIRFIPGLRAISYTLSGFFNISFVIFMAAVLSATAIWTVLIFFLVYYIGTSAWVQASELKWILIPVMLVVLYLLNTFLKSKNKRSTN